MINHCDIANLFLIRNFELTLLKLFSQGKIKGTIHTCIGQEAVAQGVIGALDPDRDTVFSNHRGHGHYLAFTNDLDGLLAEFLGKSTGTCRGIGGTQHLHFKNYYSNGIVGGAPAVSTGIALAHKKDRSGAISVAFIGDGVFGQGILYEAFNMASLWRLPILYVVENNNIAQTTPANNNRAGTLANRFRAFNIPHKEGDGQSLLQVRKMALEAISYVRNEGGPYGLIFNTHRFASHSKGDDTRPPDEVSKLKERDPLEIAITETRDSGLNSANFERKALSQIDSALHTALSAPLAASEFQEKEILRASNTFLPFKTEKHAERLSISQLINRALHEIIGQNENVVHLGEDIEDPYGGAFKVTRGLSEQFPNRVINTPISEAGFTAIANGLALRGYPVIVEIMFGDFLLIAADQIINHAVKFLEMYGRKCDMQVVIRTPMGARRAYGPTHSQSLEKHFFGIPGLTTVAVNNLLDPGPLLRWACEKAKSPILFIENKVLYSQKLAQLDDKLFIKVKTEDNPFSPRLTKIMPRGADCDILVIAYGGATAVILEAQNTLLADDIFIGLMVPELISPVDPDVISSIFEINRPVIFVEESQSCFGMASEYISLLKEKEFAMPCRRLGAANTCVPSAPHLEEAFLTQAEDVCSAIYALLG
jgi:2-oxoisovalerate dehydrogenase E1 component